MRTLFAVSAVAIFLASSLLFNPASTFSDGEKQAASSGLPVSNNSSYDPYLVNPTLFPVPSTLLNVTDNLSWAKVASGSAGLTSYYSLVYVDTDLFGNSTLMYRWGTYNTSIAIRLAASPQCLANCSGNLPISWSAPVSLLSLGSAPVQGDAIAAANFTVAVAVAQSGSTTLLYSSSLGTSGTWIPATGNSPIAGSSPNVTLQPCKGILVTTLTSANLVATTFPVTCVSGYTSLNAPAGRVSPQSGGGPVVAGLSPPTAGIGVTILIDGSGFASSATVKFGLVPSTLVTYISSTVLSAQVPTGSGVVDVRVTVGAQTSPIVPADEFAYAGAGPTVKWISPTGGLLGTVVTINGTNFTAQSQVQFGSAYSSSVTYVSSTALTATAPAGTGTLDVTVTTIVGTSPRGEGDKFTYATPAISRLVTTIGYPGAVEQIVGSNFSSGASVSFGSYLSSSVTYVSSSVLKAVIPWGNGTVFVRVTNPGGSTSVVTSACQYSFPILPMTKPRITTLLPLAYGASPVWTPSVPGINGTIGVLAGNVSTNSIVFYWTNQVGGAFRVSQVSTFQVSSGSSTFTTVGSTKEETPGGPAGTVSATVEGQVIFGLFTTRQENRTVVETATSWNFGLNWGETYFAAATVGSVGSASVASSPAGYIYGTWTDNGAGSWQVDAQEFSPSGRPVGNATVIPGSQPYRGPGASYPTVAVDGLQRPLYVWTGNNVTGAPAIFMTGAYLPPVTAARFVSSAVNATATSDYLAGSSQASISTYESKLVGNLSSVVGSALSYNLCSAETTTITKVYPYVGWRLALSSQNTTKTCGTFSKANPHPLVANLSGALTANTSLAIETQWLIEALGYGVFSTPAWISLVPTGETAAPVPFSTSNSATDGWDSLNVVASGVNPKTIALNSTWGFRTVSSSVTKAGRACGMNGQGVYRASFTNTDAPINFTTKIWVDALGAQSYTTNGTLVTTFITNLTYRTTGTWHYQVTATYGQANVEEQGCYTQSLKTITNVAPSTGWPSKVTLSTSGAYSTYFGYSPGTPFVNLTNQSSALDDIQLNWTNSLLAQSTATLFDLSSKTSTMVPTGSGTIPYSNPESLYFTNVTRTQNYIVYENSTSYPGTYNGNWGLTYNAAYTSTNVSGQTVSTSCSFTTNANPISLKGTAATNVTGVTATNATLLWHSNSLGVGWVHYKEAYGSWQFASAQEYASHGAYYYSVDLRGLTPWGLYTAIIGVTSAASGSSCLYYSSSAIWTFATAAKFSVIEQDLPYDSVTQIGGGADLYWQLPDYFVSHAKFLSGVTIYYPSNNSTVQTTLPVSSSAASAYCFYCYSANLTGLTPNYNYTIVVLMNFTYANVTYAGSSFPFKFWYLQDTTGDGLTDWEKARGWEVTYQTQAGGIVNQWVTANVHRYATNGLTSDFVEKEFGLNPNTVDTSGSHMLDTWNLTFDLGNNSSSSSTLPTGSKFQIYNELGNYNFSRSCQVFLPPPNTCSWSVQDIVKVASKELTNLSDNSGWAGEVLWSRAALNTFVNTSGVQNAGWLRAVLGNYTLPGHGGVRKTLTVWGKLSWGANPLAASTPQNGIVDGTRVKPNYPIALQIGPLWANVSDCKKPGSGKYGWAVLFYLNYSTKTGPNLITNYSSQGNASSSSCKALPLAGYQVQIPVNGSAQNVSLSLRLIENNGSTGSPHLIPLKLNGTTTVANISYDLVAGLVKHFYFNESGSSVNKISSFMNTVYAGTKTNTLLWTPTDNGTTSTLPWGLKRYIGEQSFDLITVDVPAGGIGPSTSVPFPTNSSITYQLSLPAGLTNILVPRSQFMNSIFGEGILQNKVYSYTGSTSPPALSSADLSALQGAFGTTNTIAKDLACYWQNRSIAGTSGNVTPVCGGSGKGSETGYGSSLALSIAVTAANASSGANTGGLPSNPGLESSALSGAALQSVMVMNVTIGTGLDLLLASLLDNTTGGVNGSFVSIGFEVPSLGLNSVVVRALANNTFNSSGLWGIPTSSGDPNPPPSSGIWGFLANTFSGIVAVGAAILSAAWNSVVAIAQYIDQHLPPWLKSLGEAMIAPVAAALVTVGRVLERALQALWTAIVAAAEALIRPIVLALNASLTSYKQTIWTDLNPLWKAFNQSNTTALNSAQSAQLWDDILGTPFLILLGIGIAVAIALTVVSALDFGASFLVDLVVGMIIGAVLGALASFALSLVPNIALSGPFASFAWNLTNSSHGLRPIPVTHANSAMVHPLGSNLCQNFLNILYSAVIMARVVWGASTTLPNGVRALFQLVKTRMSGFLPEQTIPIVAMATGGLSLSIALFGYITGSPLFGPFSWEIGSIIGLAGAAFGLIGLLRWNLSELQQDNTIFGAILGLAGASTSIAYNEAHC